MKAYVDQDGCISCGFCVDVCPQVFHFNDEQVSEPIDSDIPQDCIDTATEARDGCPVSVIDLKD